MRTPTFENFERKSSYHSRNSFEENLEIVKQRILQMKVGKFGTGNLFIIVVVHGKETKKMMEKKLATTANFGKSSECLNLRILGLPLLRISRKNHDTTQENDLLKILENF